VRFLRSQQTIARSKACLQRLLRLSAFRHKLDIQESAPAKIKTREFLAAYMIACFPANVFESIGPLEQAVLDAAGRMLAIFERICAALRGDGRQAFSQLPAELTAALPVAVQAYLDRFMEWKVPDEARLARRIERALLAVLQAQAQAGTAADAPVLTAALTEQAGRLREKLAQLAGAEAVARVEAAMRASGVLVG
jgi:hypothetical protein